MFVIPTHVGFTHRVVAMLVACALIMVSIGAYEKAQAANLLEISNTLTDSGPSAISGHDIRFTFPAGSSLASGDDIVIAFPTGFTGISSSVIGDLVVTKNGGAQTIQNFSATGQNITFDNITATSGDEIRIVISEANSDIVNPASIGSYEFRVTTPTDSGRTRIAIVDYVTVSAVVQTVFDFEVLGLATSTSVNGTTTTGVTTATSVPFGILDADEIYTLAQQLEVTTNAANGFVVTVEQDADFLSSTGADIDAFQNGNYQNSPTAWSAPTDQILNENTWGHWGLTSNDSDLNSGEFTSGGGNKWVAASTTPRLIFAHDGPSDGVTQDIGVARIGYQVEITPLQEAGDDYTTTLMYIATPTF